MHFQNKPLFSLTHSKLSKLGSGELGRFVNKFNESLKEGLVDIEDDGKHVQVKLTHVGRVFAQGAYVCEVPVKLGPMKPYESKAAVVAERKDFALKALEKKKNIDEMLEHIELYSDNSEHIEKINAIRKFIVPLSYAYATRTLRSGDRPPKDMRERFGWEAYDEVIDDINAMSLELGGKKTKKFF